MSGICSSPIFELLQALKKLVARAARQNFLHPLIERAPRRVIGGGVTLPVLVDGVVGADFGMFLAMLLDGQKHECSRVICLGGSLAPIGEGWRGVCDGGFAPRFASRPEQKQAWQTTAAIPK